MLQQHKHALGWIAVISGLVFVGSLFLVPWLAVRIPEDYFARPRPPRSPFADEHPQLRWIGLILKNLLGGLLFLSGLAMLLLPGQGLLTLAIGTMLLDFPGKFRLEAKIVRFGPVLKSINWLRRRSHAPPLQLGAGDSPGAITTESQRSLPSGRSRW